MKHDKIESIKGHSFFCSWSGGKDSCLALYHAIHQGGKPAGLFTMLAENGCRSRSHGLPKDFLERQARELGMPVKFNSASWNRYEKAFLETVYEFRQQGVEYGVFGDIDIEAHREWCRQMCRTYGMETCHPLWKRSRQELLREFIDLGFKATIVVTKADKLGPKWLGRTIDMQTIKDLEKAGVDICGELGEYHTVVTGGPLFKSDLVLRKKEISQNNGHWFLITE